jgi:hypothetical protein
MRTPILASLAVVTSCTHTQAIGDGRDLVGSRVIVEVTPGVEVDGVVVQGATGVQIEASNGTHSLWEVNKVTEVKALRGALEGLGIGSLIGLVGGAVIGFADGDDECDPNQECFLAFTAGEKAAITGVVFGGFGALIGLVAGALRGSRDVYEINGASPTPRFVPSGPPGSVGGATIRF